MPASQRIALDKHRQSCEKCRAFIRDAQMAERWLSDPGIWAPEKRATQNHLEGRDMLFALAKAGGGVHLEECETCADEAAIIEACVNEFEVGRIKSPSKSLRSRLLKLNPKEQESPWNKHLGSDSTAIVAGPRPATELSPQSDPQRDAVIAQLREDHSSPTDSKRKKRGQSSRRASGRKRRSHQSGSRRRVQLERSSMSTILSGLAAAAALLLMVVLFSTSNKNTGPSDNTAKNKRVVGPKRPLVSDVKNQGNGKKKPKAKVDDKKVDPKAEEPEKLPEFPELKPAPEPEPFVPQPEAKPDRSGKKVETNVKPRPEKKPEQPEQPKVDPDFDPTEAFARRQTSDDGGQLTLTSSRVVGQLALKKAGEDNWRAVKRGKDMLEVSPGDELRARGGPVFLTLSAGTELDLCLSDKTNVRIEGAKDGPVLGLGKGKIHCDYDRNFSPQRFVIRTPHSSFSSGTSTFGVEVDRDKTTTNVYGGQVFCNYSGGESAPLAVGRAYVAKYRQAPKAVGKARAAKWSRNVRPRKVIVFQANFERGKNKFIGDRVRNSKGGWSIKGLQDKDSKYWGLKAHLPKGRFGAFRVTEDLHVKFSFYVPKASPVLIQMNNATQTDNNNTSGRYFAKNFGIMEGGRWNTVTINIMNDMTAYFNPGHNTINNLDLFNEIWFYAGKPGENFKFLVDNIEIFRKVYR